ncbi:DUF1963 domain-containing protein [Dactylosporangium darangshiense]|uniref:Uncharacterized protein n=1 Tax=Dactylosporangium darangshiense TaxID=579108 RepID=A0ABP8DFT3_9ACTN
MAMPVEWRIAGFERAEEPVVGAVTKFGGQPHWIGEPQWPVSAGWGTPMRFVAQIDLRLVGGEGLAYVFVTHGEHGRDVEDFDPDVIYPDGGENAVIVQPGGDYGGEVRDLREGPTLYDPDGSAAEYTVELVLGAQPEDDAIGGAAPPPHKDGGAWRGLLRLATNWTPFYLNLGAAPLAFALLSADGRRGQFLVEDS